MIVNGYELITEWSNCTSGEKAVAVKSRKKYFLKKFHNPVAPIKNSAMDEKTFNKNKIIFEEYVGTRKRINVALRAAAGEDENIIVPSEEFVYGNQYVEASRFEDGAVGDNEVKDTLMRLSDEEKESLMLSSAEALSRVHNKNIVHSDLKLKNILIVRTKSRKYVAKLIDFDNSYFVEEKPEELVGTVNYYSPELGDCFGIEDEEELKEMEKKITLKSDIFSLGLIFHEFLCGEFPMPIDLTDQLKKRKEKGKMIYCWVALNQGCRLAISPKIKNPNYIMLINDMLKLDPTERPDAIEVVKRLKSGFVIEEPWPEHNIILNETNLKTGGIVGLKRISDGSLEKYELFTIDGKSRILTKEELLSGGYAKIILSGFAEPWPEHDIEFEPDILKKFGFVSSEQSVLGGVKGYTFYRTDSSSIFIRVETLIVMKYAKKKTKVTSSDEHKAALPTTFAEPWPEHKIVIDVDNAKAKGYIGSERKNIAGTNGYEFVRDDGTRQFIRAEMLIIQKIAKKI